MHRPIRLFAVLLAAATAMFTAIGPANAVGTGTPVITGPTAGQTVPAGWTGPITIDFSNAPADDYGVRLNCGDGVYYETADFSNDGSQGDTFAWTLPSGLPASQSCTLAVEDATTGAWIVASTTFQTGAPTPTPMAVTSVIVSPAKFYPIIRDGYKDYTALSYTLNQAATLTFTVRSVATGKVVHTAQFWQGRGQHKWSWDGGTRYGRANTGRYTLTLTAVSGTGGKATVTRTVTVATGIATIRHTLSHDGIHGTAATGGNCSVTRDYAYSVAELDCWGGRYAQMTYNFTLPRNATNLRWHIVADYSSNDICCQGNITKTHHRPTPTHAYAQVRVTGWRAELVGGVVLTYDTRRRV